MRSAVGVKKASGGFIAWSSVPYGPYVARYRRAVQDAIRRANKDKYKISVTFSIKPSCAGTKRPSTIRVELQGKDYLRANFVYTAPSRVLGLLHENSAYVFSRDMLPTSADFQRIGQKGSTLGSGAK